MASMATSTTSFADEYSARSARTPKPWPAECCSPKPSITRVPISLRRPAPESCCCCCCCCCCCFGGWCCGGWCCGCGCGGCGCGGCGCDGCGCGGCGGGFALPMAMTVVPSAAAIFCFMYASIDALLPALGAMDPCDRAEPLYSDRVHSDGHPALYPTEEASKPRVDLWTWHTIEQVSSLHIQKSSWPNIAAGLFKRWHHIA